MSDKKGWSEEKTDFWGDKYTDHYDQDGNKTGWSEEKTDFFGDKYTQHHDESGKGGWSEERTDFFGDNYTQHHDASGKEAGWSEHRTDVFGDSYTRHHDVSGGKEDWSEPRTDFFGDRYTQHYGSSAKSSERTSASETSSPRSYVGSSSGSSETYSSPTGYSSYGSATSSSSAAAESSNPGLIALLCITIVLLVCGALGRQWYITYQHEAAVRAVKDQIRREEASRVSEIRMSERMRAEQAFLGEWYYSNRTEGRLARLRISRRGNGFSGEYRSGGRVEPLNGQLEDANRLRLRNTRQVGKLVNPSLWYVGDFSHEAWLQLSNDGTVLLVSFSRTGQTFEMKRTATGATSVK